MTEAGCVHLSPHPLIIPLSFEQGDSILTMHSEHEHLLGPAVSCAQAAIGIDGSASAPPAARELVSHIVTKESIIPWAEYSSAE